jgi:Transposase IS116/IS110/IS902 family
MMIKTVDGNCSLNGAPAWSTRCLCPRRGGSAHPDRAAQQDNQHTTTITLPGHARQPLELIAQVTVAYLPSKAIDDGAGPVDQSPTAQFIPSAHNSLRTSRRDNLSRRPAIMAASPPSLGLRYHGRLGGLIHEFDQVPSCGSPIRHPHVLRAEYLHHSPLVENAFGAQVRALLRQLEATVINAEEVAAATVVHFEKHPDAEIVTSLQGLRSLTGAQVLAEIGDDRSRFADARSLKAYAGSAPVTRASGKTLAVMHRRVKKTNT